MDICPACGEGHLVEDLSDLSYDHHGNKNVIKDVRGQRCPVCNEIFMDDTEAQRVSDDMAAFRKKCKAHDSEFIRSVRKKLHLGQKEAGELFGGGVNAFSRYETGKATPPLSLLKLFRVLDAHPDLLAMVR